MIDIGDKPVVVFEPYYTGHRMDYVKHIREAAQSETVLASSSETFQSDEFASRFDSVNPGYIESFNLGAYPSDARHARSVQAWVFRALLRTVRAYPASPAIVLEGDKSLLTCAAVRVLTTARITILIMRAPTTANADLRSRVIAQVKRTGIVVNKLLGNSVFVLASATTKSAAYEHAGYPAVPDPVVLSTSVEAARALRRQLGCEDRLLAVVAGNVTRRKNLDVVIKALQDPRLGHWKLLVAGRIEPGELDRCRSLIDEQVNAGRLELADRLLGDAELDTAISAADCVILAHSAEGPSGILGKAVAGRTYIAAAGAVSLRADLERFPGAGRWSTLSPTAIADSIALASLPLPHTDLAGPSEFAEALLLGSVGRRPK